MRRRMSLVRWTVNARRHGMSLAQETVNAAQRGFDAVPRGFNPGWRTAHSIGDRFRVCRVRNPARPALVPPATQRLVAPTLDTGKFWRESRRNP
jgi:hypothetical protein